MTIRDFAYKYGIPLAQAKAATKVTEVKLDEEYEMLFRVTNYYMQDMRACVERAQKDNLMLGKLGSVFEELKGE